MDLGQRLYNAGWRQGSVLYAPGLAFGSNRFNSQTSAVELDRRNVKNNEQLVIISQDCDIVSPDEPFVDALICTRTTPERSRRWDRNSARRFVIDPVAGLIAEAKYRLPIAKDVLERYTPQIWPADDTRFRRFVRWLGRRYDRPALPDPLVTHFQNPVTAALQRLDAERPEIIQAFSTAVYEIRVSDPATEDPPFEVELVLMARRDELTVEEDQALQEIEQAIRAAVDPALVRLGDVAFRPDEMMSVAEYFATRPIFLEYLTYRGDEIEGSEPQGAP